MQLSLFSVSYAGLWGQQQLDVPDFIARAAELGFADVMLMGKRPHLSPLDTTESILRSLADCLQRHGVACRAVAAYTDFAPQRAAEVPFLEMQLDYVGRLCHFASQLQAPLVRVFTAYEAPDSAPAANWKFLVDALRQCAQRAADCGVTLAVQNHHDLAVHSAVMLELLAEVDRPNVSLAFDAWSPALRGEDVAAAARQLAPYTAMTTNADYVRWPRFRYRPELVNYERLLPDMVRAVPFGEGAIDYRAFFAGLRAGGFDGLANYEICSPLRGGGSRENLDACCRRYLEWMRPHVAG